MQKGEWRKWRSHYRSNFEIAKFVEPGGEDSRGSRSGEGVQKHHIRKRGRGVGGGGGILVPKGEQVNLEGVGRDRCKNGIPPLSLYGAWTFFKIAHFCAFCRFFAFCENLSMQSFHDFVKMWVFSVLQKIWMRKIRIFGEWDTKYRYVLAIFTISKKSTKQIYPLFGDNA